MTDTNKSRLSRLTAILTQLQSKQLITAKEIADKHQVSIRTIYRDIRALEESGVPVITEEGKGYSLMQGYNLPPVMFTESEANALITAEQLVLKNKDRSLIEHFTEAVTKLKSVLRYSQKNKVNLLSERLDIRKNLFNQHTSNTLMLIQSAITNFNLADIEYHSLQNEFTKRTVEPFALYNTQDNWVLIAFCRLRNDFRSFRLDMIRSISVQNQQFEPHKMTLREYFDRCREKFLNTPDIPLSQERVSFASLTKKTQKMETVKIKPFNIIGISVRTSNQNNQMAKDIGALRERFMTEGVMQRIPNKTEDIIYSVYTDYEGDHTNPYTVIVGCKTAHLDAVPEGMVGYSLSGGNYVPFKAKGDLTKEAVPAAWEKIWHENLDRIYSADFEVYGEKAQNPTDGEADIFVAVK